MSIQAGEVLTQHPLLGSWRSMNSRCYRKTDKDYPRYGGRGITVCDEWRHGWEGFVNFINDVGYKKPGEQIDRIDNDGNYTPENCRWVTPKENSNNRRKVFASRGRRNTWAYRDHPYIYYIKAKGYNKRWKVSIPGKLCKNYATLEEAEVARNEIIIQ